MRARSVQVPWLRSQGGNVGGFLNRVVQWSFIGIESLKNLSLLEDAKLNVKQNGSKTARMVQVDVDELDESDNSPQYEMYFELDPCAAENMNTTTVGWLSTAAELESCLRLLSAHQVLRSTGTGEM